MMQVLCLFVWHWIYCSSFLQHAHALELLKDHLKEGEKALDVGSGSGYLTVCMALMVGEKGKAVGIDHIAELVDSATENVQRDKPELLKSGRVKFIGWWFFLGYIWTILFAW